MIIDISMFYCMNTISKMTDIMTRAAALNDTYLVANSCFHEIILLEPIILSFIRYIIESVDSIIESVDSIIELVDSISRDELDVPLTQYITNA